MIDPWSQSHQWVPKGRIPCGHLFNERRIEGIWITALSRNHRLIWKITDPGGKLHVWRIRGRKSIKFNRLPRGSRRTTGVWNGQNVADMVKHVANP